MNINQVEKMINDAKSNEELHKKLVSVEEPKEMNDKKAFFEKLVSIGKEFNYNFTVEECEEMWDAKESAYLANRNENEVTRFCGISQDECIAIVQLVK